MDLCSFLIRLDTALIYSVLASLQFSKSSFLTVFNSSNSSLVVSIFDRVGFESLISFSRLRYSSSTSLLFLSCTSGISLNISLNFISSFCLYFFHDSFVSETFSFRDENIFSCCSNIIWLSWLYSSIELMRFVKSSFSFLSPSSIIDSITILLSLIAWLQIALDSIDILESIVVILVIGAIFSSNPVIEL